MDLSEGHVSTLEHLIGKDYTGCQAYNLGTGQGISVKQMIAAFEKYVNFTSV